MDDTEWWLLLPEPVRRLPADLAAVLVLVALTILAVFVPVINETPLRVVLGLPFVLFLPGYAFVAALFPEAGRPPTVAGSDREGTGAMDDHDWGDDRDGSGESGEVPRPDDRGIDGIERVALSFGLSIAVVPLLGLVLNFTPWGIRLVPIVVSVTGFTVASTVVAAVRRWNLPEDERFAVPYDRWLATGREELFEPETRVDAALNVLLAASVVLAVASVGYAVAVPKEGETFTEFYILTETEDGNLVAADYPTEFVRGESKRLVVGIVNQEHERTRYTVVVELHRVEFDRGKDNTTKVRVLEERKLRRFRVTLAHNETWHHTYAVTPTMRGRNLRLTFLLYRGSAPEDPTVDNAYRELHLWINVSAPADSRASVGRGRSR